MGCNNSKATEVAVRAPEELPVHRISAAPEKSELNIEESPNSAPEELQAGAALAHEVIEISGVSIPAVGQTGDADNSSPEVSENLRVEEDILPTAAATTEVVPSVLTSTNEHAQECLPPAPHVKSGDFSSSRVVDLAPQRTVDTDSSDSAASALPAASMASMPMPAFSAPSGPPRRKPTTTPHFATQDTDPIHTSISGPAVTNPKSLVTQSPATMSFTTSVPVAQTARAVTTTETAVLAASSAPATLAVPASASGPSSLPHPRTAQDVDAELLSGGQYGPGSQERLDGLKRFTQQRTAEVKAKLAADKNNAKLKEEVKLIQEAMWKLNGASDSANNTARDYYMKSAVAFLEAAELVHSNSSAEKENKKRLGTRLYEQALQMHSEDNG